MNGQNSKRIKNSIINVIIVEVIIVVAFYVLINRIKESTTKEIVAVEVVTITAVACDLQSKVDCTTTVQRSNGLRYRLEGLWGQVDDMFVVEIVGEPVRIELPDSESP